jgi:pyruvate kinase
MLGQDDRTCPRRRSEARRRIRVLMDIAGPKIRTRKVATPRHRDTLHVGDEILLVRDKRAADIDDVPFRTRCTVRNAFDHLKVGDPVSLDDGKLKGTIVREIEAGLVARMEEGRLKGMKLKPEKSLNLSRRRTRTRSADRAGPARPRLHRAPSTLGQDNLKRARISCI